MVRLIAADASLFNRLKAVGRQVAPLSLGLLIGALCLFQGRQDRKYRKVGYREAFPFSHYPMYSGFDDWEYLVYVADGKGKPLPLQTLTNGYKANALKKKFDDLIDDVKDAKGKGVRNRDLTPAQARPAAREVLRWLCASYPALAAHGPLRLYQIQLRREQDTVTQSEPILLGEYIPTAR